MQVLYMVGLRHDLYRTDRSLLQVARFIATGLAVYLESNFILTVYACCAIAINAYICAGHGTGAVAALIIIFFFEAPMYPAIFALGTANLGKNTRRGAGILVMVSLNHHLSQVEDTYSHLPQGVSGGAIFPPIQGAIADAASTRGTPGG